MAQTPTKTAKTPTKTAAKAATRTPRRRVEPGQATGRGGGRFIATAAQRERVMDMVAAGIQLRAISLVLKIPERTVSRHFAVELSDGQEIRNAQVGGDIVKAARDPTHKEHKTMAIYYSKARMAWSDRVQIGFGDEKGNPVNPANLFTVQITGA
jgi:hypothetical protein